MRKETIQASLNDLLEEFHVLYQVGPVLSTLENVYKEVESKYRSVKKQQEIIADRLLESASEEQQTTNQEVFDKAKADLLKCAEQLAIYQKSFASEKPPFKHETLEAMTSAVTKMADVLSSQKNANHGLEKLSVPTWDGGRKSFATWKNEFQYWMNKYKQDKDEHLQRLRKALPKNSFWSDQIRPCKTMEQAWKILDTEFGDKRKLMDTLLTEVTNLKPIKCDSKSLSRYAAKILGFVNNMEQSSCAVTSASEAPFVMSQLLSKLDPKDNIEFGREMQRVKNEENVSNLIDWLNKEASLRSRVKRDNHNDTEDRRSQNPRSQLDNHTINSETPNDEICPVGCETKHLLSACPVFQKSTVDQRWEIVKRNNRCRKCLRNHHTNHCTKPDGITCNKCTRRHHRSLHNERIPPVANSSLNFEAVPFTGTRQEASNHNVQSERKVPGLCPLQKVKIKDKDGNSVEVLAMLDSGSNTSFISKNVMKKLGISGPKTHLTVNLTGGNKKSEESELININVVSTSEEHIQKSMRVYAINKPCSPARTFLKLL